MFEYHGRVQLDIQDTFGWVRAGVDRGTYGLQRIIDSVALQELFTLYEISIVAELSLSIDRTIPSQISLVGDQMLLLPLLAASASS